MVHRDGLQRPSLHQPDLQRLYHLLHVRAVPDLVLLADEEARGVVVVVVVVVVIILVAVVVDDVDDVADVAVATGQRRRGGSG